MSWFLFVQACKARDTLHDFRLSQMKKNCKKDAWVSLHFHAFFFKLIPVEPTGYVAEKENINAEMMLFTSKLKPSRSHRTQMYHIF